MRRCLARIYIEIMAGKGDEYRFAEVLLDKKLLEAFANEDAAYFLTLPEKEKKDKYRRFLYKLNWHVRNSLAGRQREIIKSILDGKTEREIASRLGISHQVVHIYKMRAIKKLRQHFGA